MSTLLYDICVELSKSDIALLEETKRAAQHYLKNVEDFVALLETIGFSRTDAYFYLTGKITLDSLKKKESK